MTIDKIKKLIAGANLDRALKALKDLPQIQADDDHQDTLLQLTGMYKATQRDKRMGILSTAEANTATNKLSYNLLSWLSDLDDDDGLSSVKEIPASADPVVISPAQPVIVPNNGPVDDGITKILFLASNPSDTAKLQLEKEHSRVSSRLQEALEPEKYPIKLRRAVTATEFSEYLFLEKPDILHFSGHGDIKQISAAAIDNTRGFSAPPGAEANTPEPKEEAGIFLLDADKKHSHFVNTTFLKRTFKTMVNRHKVPLKAVIFNACHSVAQAEAISQVVPYVVGTSASVGDDAAIAFATGFYFGIAQGMEIEGAVDFGINAALAYNEPEDRFLLYKDGQKIEW